MELGASNSNRPAASQSPLRQASQLSRSWSVPTLATDHDGGGAAGSKFRNIHYVLMTIMYVG